MSIAQPTSRRGRSITWTAPRPKQLSASSRMRSQRCARKSRSSSMAAANRSYPWLDRLLRAERVMEKRSAEYEATLGNPNALIASPEWERFAAAAEHRDTLRDKSWKHLLKLGPSGRANLG